MPAPAELSDIRVEKSKFQVVTSEYQSLPRGEAFCAPQWRVIWDDRDFIELGYKWMRRTDYDAADVSRYRDEIRGTVVPLLTRLHGQQRQARGWHALHAWDEPLIDPQGNSAPQGDHDTLVAAGQDMFDRIDKRLGNFSG